jgi:ferrous iron transport protein B
VLRRVLDAGWAFIRRASTIILASMILIWAALYFPSTAADGVAYETKIALMEEAEDTDTARAVKAEWKQQSYLGQAGMFLEPVFAPLGWDWRISVATLASFPAREVIVGTLSQLYRVDDEDDEDGNQLRTAIRNDWDTDPRRSTLAVPIACSVMVFFALCCQCASTLAVIRRETNTWRWPVFCFVYMTVLAYVAALVVYQVGKLFVQATA